MPALLAPVALAALTVAGLAVIWLPSRTAGAATPAPVSLTWTAAHPAATPPGLTGASAAWDGDTSTVVLFGGASAAGTLVNDTWTWDGTNWTDHPAATTNAPPARQQAAMAFDPVLHRLILFGGQGADGSLLQDTWAWNGQQWTELSTGSQPGLGPSPAPRSGAAMALDSRGDLVLFGGTGYAAVDAPVSTTTTTTAPSGGSGPAGPGTAAGSGGPAQSATGARGATTQGDQTGAALTTASSTPALRVLGDTWEWTSAGWVLAASAGPPAVTGAALAYDSTSATTVLFGGSTSPAGTPVPGASDQTWIWNGMQWAAAKGSAAPPGRYGAVLADAPALGGMILTGGRSSAGVLADGWSWSPAGWGPAQVSGGSVPRSGAAWAGPLPASFSASAPVGGSTAARSLTLVFGGTDPAGDILGDTETLAAVRPAGTASMHSAPPTTAAAHSGPTIPTMGSSSKSHRSPTTPPTTSHRSAPSTVAQRHLSAPATTAAPASPAQLQLETNESTVHRGATVHLAGSGLRPGSPVTITFHSAPALVGRAIADASGSFSAYVSVPDDATPGRHHFVATGTTDQGRPAELTAAVMVIAPASAGPPFTTKAILSVLALLVPAATWLAMAGAGWWRRRSTTGPAN